MDSTGKTVDEAIREALLRMGLRREEVSINVLQEARGGILGMGRRPAIVRVTKKSERMDRNRDARGRREERPGGSGRGRRSTERPEKAKAERADQSRGAARRGGKDRGARVEAQERDARGGRGRGGSRPEAKQPAARQSAAAAEKQDAPREAVVQTARGEERHPAVEDELGGRRRRPRRRRKKSGETDAGAVAPETRVADEERRDDPAAAAEASRQVAARSEAVPPQPRAASESAGAIEIPPVATPVPVAAAADGAQPIPAEREAAAPTAADKRASAADAEVLAADVIAGAQVRRFTVDEAAELPGFLQRVATDLMVKSGFPCRVQVQAGEYHLVKLVVDDRSAGVLIGRYGNTVDAVEYLVEKIASRAAGERVRMNLDINNYRLRREDQLVQRARNAAAEARNTGEPVKLEPAGGRERRIVHLYIQEMGDLTTYTESGPDGKAVVICRPEQVPAQYIQRDGDAASDDERSAAELPQIEVSAMIDVNATSSPPATEKSAD
jgi:spoIIIJ-associated protein